MGSGRGCGSPHYAHQVLVLVIIAAIMLRGSMAKTILVGGSEGWRFGFNYTDWALRNGPFYVNDILVFKYDPPNGTAYPHSVSLLPSYRSLMKCDLRTAKLVADAKQGSGEGFHFVLKNNKKPYYFVCVEHGGRHCTAGLMKFFAKPIPRCKLP